VLALVCCARFVHGLLGPVIVMPEPLNVPTAPIATSDAWVVVAVVPEVQDELPASLTLLAVLSVADEVASPDHSITETHAEPAAADRETTTAVCPPAHPGSAQITVVSALAFGSPALTTDAKLSALPPMVIPVTVGLDGLALVTTQTTSMLPAVVAEVRVTLTVELAAAVADFDWTSDGATGYPVMVNDEQLTGAPLTTDVVLRLRSAPLVPTEPVITTVVPSDFSSAK